MEVRAVADVLENMLGLHERASPIQLAPFATHLRVAAVLRSIHCAMK
jgi:hypothetical protein